MIMMAKMLHLELLGGTSEKSTLYNYDYQGVALGGRVPEQCLRVAAHDVERSQRRVAVLLGGGEVPDKKVGPDLRNLLLKNLIS